MEISQERYEKIRKKFIKEYIWRYGYPIIKDPNVRRSRNILVHKGAAEYIAEYLEYFSFEEINNEVLNIIDELDRKELEACYSDCYAYGRDILVMQENRLDDGKHYEEDIMRKKEIEGYVRRGDDVTVYPDGNYSVITKGRQPKLPGTLTYADSDEPREFDYEDLQEMAHVKPKKKTAKKK